VKDPARRKADLIVEAARKHKAFDLVLLKVDHLTSIADYFFICSCRSSRQVQAVSEQIKELLKKKGGYQSFGVEGQTQGHWVLMDFGEVVVHIFHEPVRNFYDLEGLWGEAHWIDLGPDEPVDRASETL
jgi:ribosome-associated protein